VSKSQRISKVRYPEQRAAIIRLGFTPKMLCTTLNVRYWTGWRLFQGMTLLTPAHLRRMLIDHPVSTRALIAAIIPERDYRRKQIDFFEEP
jgi:hypothetical protein